MQNLSYSTNDVLAATGWTMNTFQSHLRREDTILQDGISPASRGVPRRYSWAAIMQFVIGGELIALGIAPSDAFQYAAKVAFLGSRGRSGPDRAPGYPFPYRAGETFLLIADGKTAIVPVIDSKLEIWNVPGLATGGLSFQAINLTRTFDRTCTRLEIDAPTMLRDIYPEE